MKSQHLALMIGLFGLDLISSAPHKERVAGVDQWDFDVYLNDKKVGKHFFKVSESGGMKQVQSEANFKYKILFDTAYQLRAQRGRALVGQLPG